MDAFSVIEKKWQEKWSSSKCFEAKSHPQKKFYNFDSAPFTNGRLHLGHARNYVLGDVLARFKRLSGFNVLYSTGFDAFGLPNERAANSKNISVSQFTSQNIIYMLEDFKRLGLSYDFNKLKTTCDPEYYKWTQWLFLKLYQKGFVVRDKSSVNWCASCETSLSYFEITESACDRCGSRIIKNTVDQWVIKTSSMLEELYDSIKEQNAWSDRIKKILKGYYSPVSGCLYKALIVDENITVDVFVSDECAHSNFSRIVSSIENPILNALLCELKNTNSAMYFEFSRQLTLVTEMMVPKHPRRRMDDEDEMEFDTGLMLRLSDGVDLPLWLSGRVDVEVGPQVYVEKHELRGVSHSLIDRGHAWTKTRFYHVHDWNVSRQKFWGTPVPILNCCNCGYVPVREEDLPVLHVEHQTEKYQYSCQHCNKPAELVPEVLDCYLDDSWCFIAGALSDLSENPFYAFGGNDWLPADYYHAGFDTYNYIHVYRFVSLFLYKENIISNKEMFLSHHGHDMVMFGNNKISKSKHNYDSLSVLLDKYGADVVRLAIIMHCGPNKTMQLSDNFFDASINFIDSLKTVFATLLDIIAKCDLKRTDLSREIKHLQGASYKTIGEVNNYYESYRPNVAVQELQLMVKRIRKFIVSNEDDVLLYKDNANLLLNIFKNIILALSPVIPHIAEEMYEQMTGIGYISDEAWPKQN